MYGSVKGKRLRSRGPSTPIATGTNQVNLPVLTAGLAIVVLVVPLVVAPFSSSVYRDPKLVALLAGTLLVAASGLRVDRRMAIAAGVWIGLVALASSAGVDRWFSFMADEERGAGFMLLASAGVLLVAGTALSRTVVDRLPGWLVGVGLLVALTTTLSRFVALPFPLTAEATLGQVVFVGAVLAAAIVTTVQLQKLPWWLLVLIVAILASGLAISTNRAGLGGVVVGLGVASWRSRVSLRRVALVAVTASVVLLLWSALPGVSTQRLNPTYVESGFRERVVAWEVLLRGWSERPVLGWGPSNTWGAFVSSVRADEIPTTGTGWSESHNLLIESLVTTGALGTLALVVLGGLTASRALRAPPHVGWAAGAALALVPSHLLQPMSIVNTTPLFLLAGIAAGHGQTEDPRPSQSTWRLSQRWVLAALVAAAGLACLRLSASTLQHRYNETGDASALSGSIRIEPPRMSPAYLLGLQRASEASRGQPDSAAEAHDLAEQLIRWHPWHPRARQYAAEIETGLGDFRRVERLFRHQMTRFPNDPNSLEVFAQLALYRGDRARAAELAKRALALVRTQTAMDILRQATAPR